jgi:uncharacterized membrane protein
MVLNFIILVTMVVWIGSIIFFSFVVAPTVFNVLQPAEAGKVVRAVFPKYYLVGIVCGLVAIGSLLLLPASRSAWVDVVRPEVPLLAMMVAINMYARQSLTPRINLARDADEADKPRFDQLHRQSVILNGVVLVLGLVALFLLTQAMATP